MLRTFSVICYFTDYVDYIVQKFHCAGLTFIFIPFFFIVTVTSLLSDDILYQAESRTKQGGERWVGKNSKQVVCKVNIWIINLAILLYFRYFYSNKHKQGGYMLCFVFLAKMWEVRSMAYVTHFKCSNITIWQLLLLEGFWREMWYAGGSAECWRFCAIKLVSLYIF